MLALYFSGTGNTKFIAELFGKYMNADCYSIEDDVDFLKLISAEDTIAFCYPVYGSRVPRIMREFVAKNIKFLKGKQIIIFCTQLIFSGDGARAFTDMFPQGYIKVIYAEHFFMPNNVSNLFFLSIGNEKDIAKCTALAEKKMSKVCGDIMSKVIKRRGFNPVSRGLGLIQGVFITKFEEAIRSSVRIRDNCTQCRLCVEICPMKNLVNGDNRITDSQNCTGCYRCINRCPQKAITVLFKSKPKRQYIYIKRGSL